MARPPGSPLRAAGASEGIPEADERRISELKTEILGHKAGAHQQILGACPSSTRPQKRRSARRPNALKREFAAAFEACDARAQARRRHGHRLDSPCPAAPAGRAGSTSSPRSWTDICEIFRELGHARRRSEAETNGTILRPEFPQGSPRPSTPRIRSTWAGTCSAHPYLACADPHARALPAAHRVVIPGQVYRATVRCLAFPGLPADRRPRRGRGISFVDFQGDLATFAPGFFTPDTRSVRPVVSPVHRAVGRDDVRCQICKASDAPRASRPAGGRSSARAWCTARVLENCAWSERYTRLRVGHGARRIAMTAHGIPTSGCCSKATCDPSRSSREGAMIVSRRWLERCWIDRSRRDVAERLTLHAAASTPRPPAPGLSDVLIARVLEVRSTRRRSPLALSGGPGGGGGAGAGADPSKWCCGAPNVQAGKTYPYAGGRRAPAG